VCVNSKRDHQSADKQTTHLHPQSEIVSVTALDENNNSCSSPNQPKAPLIAGGAQQCEGADAEQTVAQAITQSSAGNNHEQQNGGQDPVGRLKDDAIQKLEANGNERVSGDLNASTNYTAANILLLFKHSITFFIFPHLSYSF
jgi:hypothetical protein